MTDCFDQFLKLQDHAKEKHEEAESIEDRYYWQGVKDGLRKCYALMTNQPHWDVLCSSILQKRPDSAREPYGD